MKYAVIALISLLTAIFLYSIRFQIQKEIEWRLNRRDMHPATFISNYSFTIESDEIEKRTIISTVSPFNLKLEPAIKENVETSISTHLQPKIIDIVKNNQNKEHANPESMNSNLHRPTTATPALENTLSEVMTTNTSKIPSNQPTSNVSISTIPPFNQSYQLVFFTTVELFGKKRPPQRISNTLNMFSLFQKNYRFVAIVYTNDPVIISICTQLGIYTEGNYAYILNSNVNPSVNKYNMPFVRYMYLRSEQLVPNADYYGYINSDILVTPNLFSVLTKCSHLVDRGVILPKHEIASIVWNVFRIGNINTRSIKAYETFIQNRIPRLKEQRDYRSADYFIFSKAVDLTQLVDAVIGRIRVDNILLSFIHQQNGTLIDVTDRVVGIHQGLEGYVEHTADRRKASDRYWNKQWSDNIEKEKGSLQFATFKFGIDDYTRNIGKRFHERTNIIRFRKPKSSKKGSHKKKSPK